ISVRDRNLADRKVVHHAELLLRHRWRDATSGAGSEHVLQPVVAFGRLLADPIELALGVPAEPVWAEAEQVTVESVLGGAAVDHEAHVDDVMADGVGCVDLVIWRPGILGWLDELYAVAFGVEDLEPAAAVGAARQKGRRLPASG